MDRCNDPARCSGLLRRSGFLSPASFKQGRLLRVPGTVLVGQPRDLGIDPQLLTCQGIQRTVAVAHQAPGQHPATWQVYQERARQLIDAAQGTLPPDQARAALERGRQLDWQADIALLQAGLSTCATGA